MIKIPFSNLPSTTTPINDDNLNALQDNVEDVFNGTVPAGDMVVDSIRSKNMLNYNSSRNGAITNNSTSETLDYNTHSLTSMWMPCKPNTTYTISGENSSKARSRWQSKDENGTITFIPDATTITTNSTAKYLRVYYYFDGNVDVSPTSITTIQVEEGNTATSFAPFQNLNYNGETYLQTYNTITSGNFNDLMNTTIQGNTTKYYIQATNLTNQPASAYGWLTSYFQTNNTQVQIFIANNGVIYRRNKVGGNWGSWSSL